MAGDTFVAYLHPNEVGHNFMASYMGLVIHDLTHNRRLLGELPMRTGSGGLVEGRNQVAAEFLAGPGEWLLWLDSDMGFAADTLDRLLLHADRYKRPILGALCFAQKEVDRDGLNGFTCQPRPTILDYVDTGDGHKFAGRTSYPGDRVTQCAATGSACILINRRVLEAVGPNPYDRITADDGSKLGEDVSFCVRAGAAGFPVHVHTGIKTNHLKHTWVGEHDFDRLRDQPVEPAGPIKVAAVIPVKDKLELTQHVVEQLKADPGVGPILILDNGSTDGTLDHDWEGDGVALLERDGFNIHEMWNEGMEYALGFDDVTAVAILNNDLDLGPYAMTECAKALAVRPDLAAVCPNYDSRDLAAGEMTLTTEICAGRYDGDGGLAGFAMVLARDFAEHYRFPTECTWWYGDNDMVLTAQKEGRKVGIVGAATVEHLDGGSQTGDWEDPEVQEVLEADRQAFLAKWASP